MKKKITKINLSETTTAESAKSVEEYRSSDHLSPNVGYWILGEIQVEPVVDGHMVVYRTVRNGVACPGVFVSSKVEKVEEKHGVTYVTTANSIYLIADYEK